MLRKDIINTGMQELESYLGLSILDLEQKGGIHTAKEISQQPKLWLKIYASLSQQRDALSAFLENIYTHEALNIILTGAGTSAFIGNILEGPFQQNTTRSTRAVATTDLVSHPAHYLQKHIPTLLISFARSGNSPESVAACELVNTFCEQAYHLIITCNPEGQLIQNVQQNSYAFLLPEEANDLSLAMTSSFTSMLLAGLLIAQINRLDRLKAQMDTLALFGQKIITQYAAPLQKVADLAFQRGVFLGSGPLQGVAQESQLKLQELTDGQIICIHDSFLGFRHGPKAVINASTLIVYLFSNNSYAHQYETDLVQAVQQGEKGLYQIGIGLSLQELPDLDLAIQLAEGEETIEEEFLAVCGVLPAQILGFYKSLALGLKPDMPSASGAIARVVEGVHIYPYPQPEYTKDHH